MLHIGLCIPLSCSAEEITHLTALYLDTATENNDAVESAFKLSARNSSIIYGKILGLSEDFWQQTGVKIFKWV